MRSRSGADETARASAGDEPGGGGKTSGATDDATCTGAGAVENVGDESDGDAAEGAAPGFERREAGEGGAVADALPSAASALSDASRRGSNARTAVRSFRAERSLPTATYMSARRSKISTVVLSSGHCLTTSR